MASLVSAQAHSNLFVRLYVCKQDYTNTTGWIFLKYQKMGLGSNLDPIKFLRDIWNPGHKQSNLYFPIYLL